MGRKRVRSYAPWVLPQQQVLECVGAQPGPGGGPAVTGLLGGHVQAYSGPIAPPLPHINAGTLRALAVSSEKRIKALPGVPTLAELGYPIKISVGYGLLAPKGTPKEVIETIYLAAKKVVENHEASVAERLDKLGASIDFEGPEEYAAQLSRQGELFSRILKIVAH